PTRPATARRPRSTSANSLTSPGTPIPSVRKSAMPKHSWRGNDSVPGLKDASAVGRHARQPPTRETTMIRAIALAATIGALVAAGAAYTSSSPAWQDTIARWFGGPDRRAETAIALEELPICTTMASAAAVGSDADWAQLEPDFKAGKKALG